MEVSRLKSLTHQPAVVLVGLLVLAIAGFLGVRRLVNKFQHHEKDVAREMFLIGQRQRAMLDPQSAIASFRAALNYDRDNYEYELNLAKALTDLNRFDEADAYLGGLWERRPEDGDVNLQLARLAVHQGSVDDALRYYHNAIYGIWPSDSEVHRRRSRLELISFLLTKLDRTQAQAELIAMASGLPPDLDPHLQVANLFFKVGDYDHSLAQFREVLALDPKNPQALAGAGQAAFQLGQYATAERYLRGAWDENHRDAETERLLKTASLVLNFDPSRRRISDRERFRRVAAAFHQAGDRLQSCAAMRKEDLKSTTPPDALQSLYVEWLEWKGRIDAREFRADSKIEDNVVDLVGRIEQQTASECGEPTGPDLALLLITRDREGAER